MNTMTRSRVISHDQWLEEFAPDSELYETYGDDWNKVSQMPTEFVWTLLDTGDGREIVCNGRYFVNRIGYYIGKVPHNINDGIIVSFEED